ncbi:PA2778 family cysteine peptidase [Pontibacterium granulatum]|uniref:PA2778 family cysteine peptidase n=1 Tax=Pontibacterium granulatum TaxID=2036029 RepID=UPI00249CBE81|nr:PA2778 family cysteine peptidase [Pontibacterium granulatum]MDI3323284.1 PA2778 family cysteine peptidase [Pontibacterium granulatum]
MSGLPALLNALKLSLWLVLGSLFLSGCSHQAVWREQVDDQLQLPVRVELADTPFFPQTEYHCGPAALATVLAATGVETTPDELTPYVYLPERQGSLQIDLVSTTRRYERLPYALKEGLDALFTEVANNYPVLVMQNLGFDWFPQWHYAVVVGYDLDQETVTLRSGEEKRHVVPIYTFDKTWERAQRWAMVAASPDRIPVTADVHNFVRVVNGVEKLHPDAAITAYQHGVERWQDNALLWLALGNALYDQQQFQDSVRTYRQALQTHPENVLLWNNYAYALRSVECGEASRAAIHCAVQIKPDDLLLRDSLVELHQHKEANGLLCDVVHCPHRTQ